MHKAFNLEKMNLMAHSWGGLLTVYYAIKYLDNLSSLLLINSTGASSAWRDISAKNLQSRTAREDSLARAQLMQSEDFKKRTQKHSLNFLESSSKAHSMIADWQTV